MGLPPERSLLALQEALRDWRRGTANSAEYDQPLTKARATYAALVGVDPSEVAVGGQASMFAGGGITEITGSGSTPWSEVAE